MFAEEDKNHFLNLEMKGFLFLVQPFWIFDPHSWIHETPVRFFSLTNFLVKQSEAAVSDHLKFFFQLLKHFFAIIRWSLTNTSAPQWFGYFLYFLTRVTFFNRYFYPTHLIKHCLNQMLITIAT